jgi:UTP--glucose-1-phosphate uridylyltransferase
VYQLESAMGAAISIFPRAAVLRVPRKRFAPVKTTSDLLVVRSDAFDVNEAGHMVPGFHAEPPMVELDARYYGRVQDFERRFPAGPPSLRHCRRLTVTGDVHFEAGVVLRGEVRITNRSPAQTVLRGDRSYEGEIDL